MRNSNSLNYFRIYLGHWGTTGLTCGKYAGALQFGGVPISGAGQEHGGGFPFGQVCSGVLPHGGGLPFGQVGDGGGGAGPESHGGALPFGHSGWRYPGPGKFEDTGLLSAADLELWILLPLFTGM